MSAAATYQQFLAAPNSALLAANASLHYITTTSSFNGPTEIIKHLNTLRNQVKKKADAALDVIEGHNALVLITNTTLEFLTTGAVYLPGLDDNFLADRTVHIPITHIVNFDGDGKIAQIRQTWDQGSLLKQVDVIGRSGRNWPIRESEEQIKLITNCLKATGKIAASAPDANDIIIRSRGNTQNITRDPHASLALFAPREQQEEAVAQAAVSPYAGTRPHQRSITDILNDEPLDEPASPSNGRARDESPSKAIAPKIGAGKNFAPSRLFDADENAPLVPDSPEDARSPEKFYRPHPAKYKHFDFADGSDPKDAAIAAAAAAAHRPRSSKNNSGWSFEDFTTPQKPKASKAYRHQDVRHWDTDKNTIQETPVQNSHKPRRDAEPHFEFIDDGEREGEPRQAHPRGASHNTGLHLYENNLYNEDGSAPTPGPARPLGNITNISDRRKDFDAHFAMNDKSPGQVGPPQAIPRPSDNLNKAVNMMNANWSSYDKSPVAQKENKPQSKQQQTDESGINIAGDGMGGRKGTNRDWLYGDADDDTPKAAAKKPAAGQKSFWDF